MTCASAAGNNDKYCSMQHKKVGTWQQQKLQFVLPLHLSSEVVQFWH